MFALTRSPLGVEVQAGKPVTPTLKNKLLLTGVWDFLPAWTNVGSSLDELKLLASSATAAQTLDCKLCFSQMAAKVVANPE